MRLVVILLAALWGIAAVLVFVRTQQKSADAKLTAAYILLWPLLVVTLILNEPVPMWIAVPAMFGFIPWLMAWRWHCPMPNALDILQGARNRPASGNWLCGFYRSPISRISAPS